MTTVDAPALGTSPDDVPRGASRGAVRDAWRHLTSMRTALVLLFLLALAAVPGSLLPQQTVDPAGVERWYDAHSRAAPVVDALGGFDVYASPLFFSLYVALAVSLVGCLTPRLRLHWRALRSRPPAPPRHLERLSFSATGTTAVGADAVVTHAQAVLRRARWRVELRVDESGRPSVAAEKGYARETGNLVFHLALLGLLAGVAFGWAQRFEGRVLLVEGGTFTHSQLSYDLPPKTGRLVSVDDLPTIGITLDDFEATYLEDGQPSSFRADVSYTPDASSGDEQRQARLRVNHPLSVAGMRVFLLDHGFAPVVEVRDSRGRLVHEGATPAFGPAGGVPRVVVKVPDLGAGLPQLGIEAFFFPDVEIREGGELVSRSPAANRPAMQYRVLAGDLGLDSGLPQRVDELDLTDLVETNRGVMLPGDTVEGLPGGATMRFVGWREWASLQVSRDPGKPLVLAAAVLVLVGLGLSLRVRRRRIWVRATGQGAVTLVEVGGLPRGAVEVFREEFERLAPQLVSAPAQQTGEG
jgi:cytochrome c biogenesis protein